MPFSSAIPAAPRETGSPGQLLRFADHPAFLQTILRFCRRFCVSADRSALRADHPAFLHSILLVEQNVLLFSRPFRCPCRPFCFFADRSALDRDRSAISAAPRETGSPRVAWTPFFHVPHRLFCHGIAHHRGVVADECGELPRAAGVLPSKDDFSPDSRGVLSFKDDFCPHSRGVLSFTPHVSERKGCLDDRGHGRGAGNPHAGTRANRGGQESDSGLVLFLDTSSKTARFCEVRRKSVLPADSTT